GQDHVGVKFDKVRGCGANEVHVVAGPALVELGVDARRPTTFSQLLAEGAHAHLHFRVCRRGRRPNSPPAPPPAFPRARRERPCRRTANEPDELAAPHSITSSARASSVGGTSRPSVLAVFKLITSSYLVGACTGRLVGFSPLRMRST